MIKNAINEFKKYTNDDLYSIQQINFWLSEYFNLYTLSKESWNKGSCYDELPCSCTLNNEYSIFENFYNSLKTISEYHKLEEYFKQEFNNYLAINNDKVMLRNWIKKNRPLILSEYSCFITDYLDYSDTCYNLKIFINGFNEFEIFVKRDNFLNTLSCIEIFNEMNLEEIT